MHPRWNYAGTLSFGLALALLAARSPAPATDFVRGDANGDGLVSVSDVYFLDSYFFLGTALLSCESAGDADDSGRLEISDSIRILRHLFSAERTIPAPFPEPGPDPTPEDLGCASYGGNVPVEDPAAQLRIGASSATGGSARRAVITFEVGSSYPLGGFQATIHDPSGVLETGTPGSPLTYRLQDLTGVFEAGYDRALAVDGRLHAGFLVTLTLPNQIPPGELRPAARLIACVRPGTAAGEYPLVLEAAELAAACAWESGQGCEDETVTGRPIRPQLIDGVLVVEAAVDGGADCDTRIPPPIPEINVRFALQDAAGSPGTSVAMPFSIRADRPSQGFSYSIRFDPAALQASGTRKLFERSGGTPYEFERFEFDNGTGFLVGAAIISLTDTADVLPPSQDVGVLEFTILIRAGAPAGPTALEFEDGGSVSGGAVRNQLIAGGQDVSPELAISFVFVNAVINIVPDGIPFVRGDSNRDGAVNISDAQYSLNYLYLGGARPLCPDAADANDDGGLDVSDAIATLQFLFGGRSRLPPPLLPGADPTPDGLGCSG